EALFLLTKRRSWRPAAMSIGSTVVLLLPWLVSVSVYSGESSTWRGFIGVWDMLRVLLLNFASQGHLPDQIDGWFSLLAGLAVLAGLLVSLPWLRLRRQSAPGTRHSAPGTQHSALLMAWLLFPVAAVYAASFKEPLFSPRYFIVVVPAFLLLAAAGLLALPRPATLAGLAIISAGSVWAIGRGNTVPAYAKEDYRLAGSYVSARSDPGDAILLVANYIVYPFQYYFHGAGRVLPLDVTPVSNVDSLLSPMAGGYDHVWLVEAHDVFVDPQDRVGKWLRARYPVADEKYITGIHFIEFDPHVRLDSLPPGAQQLDVRWQDGPELAGLELRPGNPEGIRLVWKANGPLPRDYHLSLKLWTSDGKLGGQQDGEPLNAGLPFSHFPARGFVRDDHYLSVPPGTYRLKMSVYLHEDLPIVGRQDRQLDLGTVRVS
ncbi:MAG: hypothetical protein KGJ86_10435, partial [Chloroflexota bacterium]|nr:hypothetical protein [Chloroflexota bacterium]